MSIQVNKKKVVRQSRTLIDLPGLPCFARNDTAPFGSPPQRMLNEINPVFICYSDFVFMFISGISHVCGFCLRAFFVVGLFSGRISSSSRISFNLPIELF